MFNITHNLPKYNISTSKYSTKCRKKANNLGANILTRALSAGDKIICSSNSTTTTYSIQRLNSSLCDDYVEVTEVKKLNS